jgi:hypothetical protein
MSQHNINALAGFDWSKVLSKVDQKWHASFKEYALTGQGSEEFLYRQKKSTIRRPRFDR